MAVAIGSTFISKNKLASDPREGKHYVSVVGRRWNESAKSCEYLIRNSWGQDFYGHTAGWTPDLQKAGHVWVSKAALARNINKVDYLE